MNVDKATLNYLSGLARLEIDDKDADGLIADLNKILSFVEKLKDVNTEGLEPLVFINEGNEGREDIATAELSRADAMKNAPHHSIYFKVPKVKS
jgi:aspartyl-tRNA(Asn)/glutamyl-tRNA(Gln) amidotransferase subunit C